MPDHATRTDSPSAPASLPPNMPSPQLARLTVQEHAVALDAVHKDKPSAVQATGRYLDELAAVFSDFVLEEPANGLLDAKVLAAIELSAPYLDDYRALLVAIARHPECAALTEPLCVFLGQLLARKRDPGNGGQQSHLWHDGFRYLLREWFLTTAGVLLHRRRYRALGRMLAWRYDDCGGGPGQSFIAFDSFVKTLDEFRSRRLGLSRVSLSADLLHQRLDESVLPLADVMQADFLLCLRSLLHSRDILERWYPRTLVFGDAYASQGFDLFVTATDPVRFAPLTALLEVADRGDLIDRFAAAESAFSLQDWELGGVAVDFRGYMGLRNAALRSPPTRTLQERLR